MGLPTMRIPLNHQPSFMEPPYLHMCKYEIVVYANMIGVYVTYASITWPHGLWSCNLGLQPCHDEAGVKSFAAMGFRKRFFPGPAVYDLTLHS